MHILFVCAEFPFLERPTGGFGSYVNSISKGLKQAGHKISIICYGNVNRRFLDKYKRNIYVLEKLKKIKYGNSIVNRLYHFWDYPLRFSRLVNKLISTIETKEKIDIIEGGDFGAELFFYLLPKKNRHIITVIKLHTPGFVIQRHNNGNNNLFYRVLNKLESYCLIHCHRVYSPTKSLAGIVKSELKINVSDIIPYPIMEKSKLTKKCSRLNNLVLYVGKLQPKKGIFTLFKAIPIVTKTIPRAKFVFIGPDTLLKGKSVKSGVINQADKYNMNNVQFINDLPQVKLFNYYRKACMLIVPSYWENFPNVVLEAGIFGLPVIAGNVGGIPEIIKNNYSGILVKPKDSRELADKIILLLQNNNLRKKLSANLAKDLTKKYSLPIIAQKTISYYEKILTSQKAV